MAILFPSFQREFVWVFFLYYCINQQPDTTVLLENNNMVCSNILLNAIQIIMFLSHILEMKLPGVNFLHFFNFTFMFPIIGLIRFWDTLYVWFVEMQFIPIRGAFYYIHDL